MNMVLNEEQVLLRDTMKAFLQEHADVSAMRTLRDTKDPIGYSLPLWQQLTELGVGAIVMPEAYGGLGFGFLGLGAVMQEMGRTLTATPLLSSVILGASAIELAGSASQRQALLPAIAAGKLTLTLAVDEASHHAPLATRLALRETPNGLRLNGTKVFVLDGHVADKFVVVARSAGDAGDSHGLTLVLVEATSPGVTISRTTMIDGRNSAELHFENTPVNIDDLVGAQHSAWPIIEKVIDRGTICLAAEMLGGAHELFARTLAYLKEREQFDVKIGSFQALQHRCALLYCQLEQCQTAVQSALGSLDSEASDIALQASIAKALVNDCYQLVSNEAIQLHGGMGITDELDIGLFLKRARVCLQLLGDTSYHLDRYATRLNF